MTKIYPGDWAAMTDQQRYDKYLAGFTWKGANGDICNYQCGNATPLIVCTPPQYDQWGAQTNPGNCSATPIEPAGCNTPAVDHGCASHAYQKNWNPTTCSWDQVRCDAGCDYGTGWCKDPDMGEPPIIEPPSTGGDTACSKGNSYAGGISEAFTRQCAPGYDAVGGLTNTKCVCSSLSDEEYFNESPTAVKEFYETPKDQQAGPGLPDLTDQNWFGDLGNIMKILPTLIIMLVVVQIIGAFRR